MCLAELHKFKEDLSRRATEARESSDVAPLLARMSELFVEIMLELSDRKIAYLESKYVSSPSLLLLLPWR